MVETIRKVARIVSVAIDDNISFNEELIKNLQWNNYF
jgi:hypothetical protein